MIRLLIVATILFVPPALAEDESTPQEAAAECSCKALAEAQEIYHRTDWDSDGVLEYSLAIHGTNKFVAAEAVIKIDPPTEDQKKQIADQIRKLGADEFAEREAASAELAKIGPTALEQLAASATASEDAEVKLRCENLMQTLRERISPLKYDAGYGLYSAKDQEGVPGLVDFTCANAECPPGVDISSCASKNGYLFRLLTNHKENGNSLSWKNNGNLTLGYGFVAFPKEYGKNGAKKIFMISNSGTIYTVDLGSKEKTEEFAKSCDAYEVLPGAVPVE